MGGCVSTPKDLKASLPGDNSTTSADTVVPNEVKAETVDKVEEPLVDLSEPKAEPPIAAVEDLAPEVRELKVEAPVEGVAEKDVPAVDKEAVIVKEAEAETPAAEPVEVDVAAKEVKEVDAAATATASAEK